MKSTKYVVHSLKISPIRTIMGLLTIITTIFLMISIGVVFSAGHSQFREIFTSGVDYDIEITKTTDPYNPQYLNTSQVNTIVGNTPGITGFYPILSTLVYTYSNGTIQSPVLIFCTPADYQTGKVGSLVGKYDISGNNIVVSKDLSIKLNTTVGESLNITLFNKTGIPFLKSYNVSGIIDVTGRFPPGANLFLVKNITDMQVAFDRVGYSTSIYITVDQSLYDITNVDHPAAKVQNLAQKMAVELGPDYHVSSLKSHLLDLSFQATGTFGSLSYVFSIIFPAISGIMIASILNLSVEEKTQELAILRFIGAKRGYVARVVFLELGFMLIISIPIGVVLGATIPGLLLTGILGTNLVPSLSLIITQIIIAVLIIILFSMQPLLKAFNTNPIDAIQKTKKLGTLRFVGGEGVDRRLVAVGLVIFIIVTYSTMVIPYILIFSNSNEFIFFVMISIFIILLAFVTALLGVLPYIETGLVSIISPVTKKTNKLTRRNLKRYTRRNISTNVIFGVIVAIMIFTSTIISGVRVSAEDSIKYVNGADIRVSTGSPFALSECNKIQNHSGIESSCAATESLSTTASKLVEPSGTKVSVYGMTKNFSFATFVSSADFYSGNPSCFEKLDNNSVIISRSLSVNLELNLGDQMAFRLSTKNKFVNVTGILNSLPGYANEVSSTQGGTQACFVSQELYAYLEGVKGVLAIRYTNVFIKVKNGYDPEKIGTDLKNEYATNQLVIVLVTVTLVKQIRDGLSFIEIFLALLTAMLMIVAVFSLVTNLYASVSERSYEIGVLKAMGLRDSSLMSSILTESIVIALASMIIGVVTGILVGWMAMYWIGVFSPMGMRFEIPFTVIMYLIAATVIASLAGGYFPARSVAKKEIISLMKKIE